MKLMEIWIENFGKLSHRNFVLAEGCNIHYGENGSGKTTLAVFIKVMFFGFEGERKQAIGQNERKKYMPWQGGAYGGKITFCYADKRYRMIRIFGSKANKDIFELRDADTNLFSQDFTENIGEEIFGVDRESFIRTIFINQNKSKVVEATGSIHAKLSYLAENTDDMAGYDQAIVKLTKKISELNSRTGTTSLQSQKNRITELEMELRRQKQIEEKEAKILVNKLKMKSEYEELKQKQADFQQEWEQRFDQIVAKKAKRDRYQFSELEKERQAVLKYQFAIGVPEKEEIQAALLQNTQISKWQSEVAQIHLSEVEIIRLNQYQKAFPVGVPDIEMLDEVIRVWYTKGEKSQNIFRWEKEVELQELKLEGEKSNVIKRRMAWGIGVALIIGAILFFFRNRELAMIFLTVGSLLIATSFWLKSKRQMFVEHEIRDLSNQIEEEKLIIEEIEREIQRFFMQFQMPYKAKDMPDLCHDWKKYSKDYKQLMVKKENLEKSDLIIKLNEALADREVFLRKYKIPTNISDAEKAMALLTLVADIEEYRNLCQKEKQMQIEERLWQEFLKSKFASVQNLSSFDWKKALSDQRQNEQAQIDQQLRDIHEKITVFDRELTMLQNQREELQEKEHELAELKANYVQSSYQAEMLKRTTNFLENARESFTKKYQNPLLLGFSKYYKWLIGQDAKEYFLDANIHLTKEELGRQRGILDLSMGWQDLIGFCMRMALVDTMYPQEKPFLILDDPFVNLDQEKTEKAMEFLKVLSREYQIIYFTCHQSRRR